MAETPEQGPEERLPVPRPPVEPAPVERFTSPPQVRTFELTPERAAQVVRQSSNARWVGFLGVVVVVLFIAVYWFYELGPLGISTPRLDAEANAQQVTAVERGYNLFEANCARCHGTKGEGGIGPTLNRQDKLFAHLNANYIRTVLNAGGRYVCGNPNSLMPVWSNTATPPGPLNYIQIDDLIAFIRAPSDHTYVVRDPSLFEPVDDPITGQVEDVQGLGRPELQAGARCDALPGLLDGRVRVRFGRALGLRGPVWFRRTFGFRRAVRIGPAERRGRLGRGPGHRVHHHRCDRPGRHPFVIAFDNEDAGTPHNVVIKDATGAELFKGDVFPGVATKDYNVPALKAGTYTLACIVHPNMHGTLTAK